MKLVKENINYLFKPKSKEEIINSIENISIKSYKLSSYFKLISEQEKLIKIIKIICKKMDVNPEEMEISTLLYNNFVREIMDNLINNDLNLKNIIFNINGIKNIYYSLKYKIIYLYSYSGEYIIYPKKEIKNIIKKYIQNS